LRVKSLRKAAFEFLQGKWGVLNRGVHIPGIWWSLVHVPASKEEVVILSGSQDFSTAHIYSARMLWSEMQVVTAAPMQYMYAFERRYQRYYS
jgi:hypothetical protein